MDRIQKFRDLAVSMNLENAIIKNPISIFYLTSGEANEGTLLITNDKAYLFVNLNSYKYVKENVKSENINVIMTQGDEIQRIKKIISSEAVFIEKEYLTSFEFDSLMNSKTLNIQDGNRLDFILEKLQMIKDNDEIDYISKSQKISEDALSETLKMIKEGVSEKDIAYNLRLNMCKFGSEKEAFRASVSAGKHTTSPHWNPTGYNIKKNDIILIDMGSIYNGYCSDMTRIICIGNPTEEMKTVYNHCLNLHNIILENCIKGNEIMNIYLEYKKYCDKYLGKYTVYFNAGHAIGLKVHQTPILNQFYLRYILQDNMVLAIEPQIIANDFGIRIENLIQINGSSPKLLSNYKYDEIIVV